MNIACRLTLLCVVALALAGCVEPRALSGVYVEEIGAAGVSADRLFAFRVTVYEFGDEVGGFVEYFEIDGLNTRQEPYVTPTFCAYFGPLNRLDDGFVLRATGVADDDLQLRFRRRSRRAFTATVEATGGTYVDEGSLLSRSLAFQLDQRTPADVCPPEATVLEQGDDDSSEPGATALEDRAPDDGAPDDGAPDDGAPDDGVEALP